jgi:hypothetical protein
MPSKLIDSPSPIVWLGKRRSRGHSSPNMGRMICSLISSSRRITTATLVAATIGISSESTSSTVPP